MNFRPMLFAMPDRRWMILSLVGTVLLGGAITPVSAIDTITRKSSRKHGGEITAMTRNDVTIKESGKDATTIPLEDIQSIDWTENSLDYKDGLRYETSGRLKEALDSLVKARAGAIVRDYYKGELDFVIARVTARIALADPSRREEAVKKLEAFQKSFSEHYRLYESAQYLGKVQQARQDYAAAREAFDLMTKASAATTKLDGRIAQARLMLAEEQFDEALTRFSEIATNAKDDNPAEKSRKLQALVGQARCLMGKGQHQEALTALEDIINNGAADDVAVQAEGSLQIGNCLMALGRNKSAILAYLKVDLLFERETAAHAEALFQLTRAFRAVDQKDRADDIAAKLRQRYPNSDWTKKLAS